MEINTLMFLTATPEISLASTDPYLSYGLVIFLSVVDALLFDLLLDLYEKDKRQISL
jgi:uncharacterized membrane protein YkgB